MPWRRKWQPTPAFLSGESHGQRSLVGYSPWGRKESDTTERLHFLSLFWLKMGRQYYFYWHPKTTHLPGNTFLVLMKPTQKPLPRDHHQHHQWLQGAEEAGGSWLPRPGLPPWEGRAWTGLLQCFKALDLSWEEKWMVSSCMISGCIFIIGF